MKMIKNRRFLGLHENNAVKANGVKYPAVPLSTGEYGRFGATITKAAMITAATNIKNATHPFAFTIHPPIHFFNYS